MSDKKKSAQVKWRYVTNHATRVMNKIGNLQNVYKFKTFTLNLNSFQMLYKDDILLLLFVA